VRRSQRLLPDELQRAGFGPEQRLHSMLGRSACWRLVVMADDQQVASRQTDDAPGDAAEHEVNQRRASSLAHDDQVRADERLVNRDVAGRLRAPGCQRGAVSSRVQGV